MEEVQLYIIKEAEKLFMKYGLRSVTMDDIAKHLGMSKKTLYVNFKDKNDLVNHMFTTILKEDECQLDCCSAEAENAIDEMFKIMNYLKDSLSGINPIVFYDLEKYHAEANGIMKDFKHGHILQKCKINLERGIKEGLYRDDLNIEVLAASRVSQIDWVFESDLVRGGKYSLYEVITELTNHFLCGVATQKGLELITEYKDKYK
ncbi:TetR/AcrR family transcriptional regulator [Pedobacter glucosidilyticus]|uniref:TetR/AcrR family transcriptional regulator n=1 Tax=Pedobacter glucosidilyticus TaxID=1122941 RepID=UPI000407AD7F|nr:TetR/AcrR family transcriptional regulator [Pedobacter glucosidilyticus]